MVENKTKEEQVKKRIPSIRIWLCVLQLMEAGQGGGGHAGVGVLMCMYVIMKLLSSVYSECTKYERESTETRGGSFSQKIESAKGAKPAQLS